MVLVIGASYLLCSLQLQPGRCGHCLLSHTGPMYSALHFLQVFMRFQVFMVHPPYCTKYFCAVRGRRPRALDVLGTVITSPGLSIACLIQSRTSWSMRFPIRAYGTYFGPCSLSTLKASVSRL